MRKKGYYSFGTDSNFHNRLKFKTTKTNNLIDTIYSITTIFKVQNPTCSHSHKVISVVSAKLLRDIRYMRY